MLAPPQRRAGRASALLTAGLVLATGLLVLLLHLRGGAWYVVETPSMGRAAPVGTLVVSVPVSEGTLRPGDVVTYSPPGIPGSTVTHRVVSVASTGVTTRGDANLGADPWRLTSAEIRGRAIAVVPGVGWLIRAMPVLLAGLAVVLAVGAVVQDRALRATVQVLCGSAAVCGVVLAFRPLVNAAVAGVLVGPSGTDVRLIGTGLLPVRVTAHARSLDLTSGGAGVLHLPAGTTGRIDLVTALHLPPWGWSVFAAVCALPLLAVLTTLVRRRGGA